MPPSLAVPNQLVFAHSCPIALRGHGLGVTLMGGGSEHGLGGRVPPGLHSTLLPALFLFFNLMLLWVLSCLYENKNNPSASASAQPLPKALPTPGGSAQPPTPQNAMTQSQDLCLSQGGSSHSSLPDGDLCLQRAT